MCLEKNKNNNDYMSIRKRKVLIITFAQYLKFEIKDLKLEKVVAIVKGKYIGLA